MTELYNVPAAAPPSVPPQPPAAPYPPPPPCPPPPAPVRRPGVWRQTRRSPAFKLFFVALLALLLVFPLKSIRELLAERQGRHQAAVTEIARSWGPDQTFAGPVLAVPDGSVDGVARFAYYLPDDLDVDVHLEPMERAYGIYRAILYRATLSVRGRFDALPADAATLRRPADAPPPDWSRAALLFAVDDLRGVAEAVELAVDGTATPVAFAPGGRLPFGRSGLAAPIAPATPGGAPDARAGFAFSFAVTLKGHDALRVAPLARTTRVAMDGAWPHPSFHGRQLPEAPALADGGFRAEWRTAGGYANDLPRQWSDPADGRGPGGLSDEAVRAAAFGVRLLEPVDHYHLVERAVKYGLLFVALAFAAFFLFELLGRRPIHPFQYALIGGALCLFYLALLALSEVMPFGWAYLAGAAAATFLVAFYCSGVLGGLRRGLQAGAALALVYVYLYIVLTMQDWSLVAGTAGLFAALFVLMALTRRVDWYGDPDDRPAAP